MRVYDVVLRPGREMAVIQISLMEKFSRTFGTSVEGKPGVAYLQMST